MRAIYWSDPQKYRRKFKAQRERLDDIYVVHILRRKLIDKSKPIPYALVELKRRQIALKRAIRQHG